MSALIGKFEEMCVVTIAIAAAVCAERNRLADEITAAYVAEYPGIADLCLDSDSVASELSI